jgi:circadian clock protein KaiB
MNDQEQEDALTADKPKKDTNHYMMRLFVTGATPNSIRAISNLKRICEQYIPERYSLEIIDVYQDTSIAEKEQLVALPLLIKKRPFPERRLIGDMSNSDRVLRGLGIIATF